MLLLAAVMGRHAASLRLPSVKSIFLAVSNALLLALKFVASSDEGKIHDLFLILALATVIDQLSTHFVNTTSVSFNLSLLQ